jgi:hypothetical protein
MGNLFAGMNTGANVGAGGLPGSGPQPANNPNLPGYNPSMFAGGPGTTNPASSAGPTPTPSSPNSSPTPTAPTGSPAQSGLNSGINLSDLFQKMMAMQASQAGLKANAQLPQTRRAAEPFGGLGNQPF